VCYCVSANVYAVNSYRSFFSAVELDMWIHELEQLMIIQTV